jgi:hypothetical protein
MTEPTPAPEAVEPAAAQAAPEAFDDETPASDALAAARREAADRRVRLKAAEDQNAQLTERIASMQRTEVERLAAATLAQGSDVFLDGAELAAFLDDDGEVSVELVTAAAEAAAAARPGLAAARPSFDGGARKTPQAPAPTFAETLKKAVGR